MEMRIVIDTREQRPFIFPEWVKTRVGTLKTGDYALDGDLHFAVERKSLDDFIGTIFTGWERFQRELKRMDAADFTAKVILVEADFQQILFRQSEDGAIVAPEHNHVFISPQAVVARTAELLLMSVNVVFCGDASRAALMCYYLLAERHKRLQVKNFLR